MRCGIALFDDVIALDWVAPWEVFSTWARLWPDDGVSVVTVAETIHPVRCVGGLRVLPDTTWAEGAGFDVFVYPGGPGAKSQLGDERVRARVRALSESVPLVGAVSTGALVLADAGLLDGRAATTHWGSLDLLESTSHDIEVRTNVRFVDAGPVVTSAGVSAGIDLAFHLVARLHSTERALAIARALEYPLSLDD